MDINTIKDRKNRKKAAKVLSWIAVLFLVLGFLPWTISWKTGLVLAIFSLVAGGVIIIAIRDPDPPHEQYDPDHDDENDGIPKAPE